jgi:hypothetical protein
MAGKGNNTAGRAKITSYKVMNGKTVIPVLYSGKNAGHGGTYMTGTIDNQLVIDSNGRPIPYKAIRADEKVSTSS